jgi:Zn-dependent peptidase ImmA (M78 family)
MPTEALTALPRVRVVHDDVPVSGSAHWDGRSWLVVLNSRERSPRQRFALAHELKHIVDHTTHAFLYNAMPGMNPVEQAERAADYFAGCLLAPRSWLRAACADGAKSPKEIARLFAIPVPLAETRLTQCGLAPNNERQVGSRFGLPSGLRRIVTRRRGANK